MILGRKLVVGGRQTVICGPLLNRGACAELGGTWQCYWFKFTAIPPPLDRPLHALHAEKSCARHSVVLLVKGEYIR